MAPEYPITISRGKTFAQTFLYASDRLVYKPISAMLTKAPCQLTVVGHGIPDGWPVSIAGVKSPAELNTEEGEYRLPLVVDVDTIELNDFDASDLKPYVNSGRIVYSAPSSLVGCEVRAQVRTKIGGDVLFVWNSNLSATPAPSAGGTVVIDGASVTLNIDAVTTAALDWSKGVYDVEVEFPGGEVRELIHPSAVAVVGEVTA